MSLRYLLASAQRPALAVLSIAGLVALWQLLVRGGTWGFGNLPTPLDTVAALWGAVHGETVLGRPSSIFADAEATLLRVWVAFAAAAVVGVPVGLWLGVSRCARDWLAPVIGLLRPIPPVAWVPVALIASGANELGVVFTSFIGAVFPILSSTTGGVTRIDPIHLRVAHNLGARRLALFREVVLPGALPQVCTGLSVGMAVAWMANVGGEMVASQEGLGALTFQAFQLINYQMMIVGVIGIGLLGGVSTVLVRWVGRRALIWHPESGVRT